MSATIEFSPAHQSIIDAGRRCVEQKIVREFEARTVLHQLRVSEDTDAHSLRLGEEAVSHATLMVSAAFMELYLDLRARAREEIAAEAQLPSVPQPMQLLA